MTDRLLAETQLAWLDRQVTPVEALFTGDDPAMPDPFTADPDDWRLRVDGEVDNPLDLTLGELQRRYPVVSLQLQVEAAMPARDDGRGTIVNCVWTGVRLRDVLEDAETRPEASAVAGQGVAGHAARAMPLAKAVDPHTLIALAVNGGPLSHLHGHPVRLIHSGWPASTGTKWLTRISVGRRVHDDVAQPMPVGSILTSHADGARLPAGTRRIALRGSAWAGERAVAGVQVSLDHGASWSDMALERPVNRFAWQRWSGEAALPSDGHVEIQYRATDDAGAVESPGHVVLRMGENS